MTDAPAKAPAVRPSRQVPTDTPSLHNPRAYTTAEVAYFFQSSVPTIERMVAAGELKPLETLRGVRFSPAEVRRVLGI